jgi:hypothetical protein
MDLAGLLVVVALVAIVPLAVFLGLVCLGILIWSWKRIGPYFVSFGRWVADWRNFIPLGCLGILAIISIVLFAAVLPEELSLLRVLLLGLVGVVGFFFAVFAILLWTVRLVAWLWPRFRREFWLNLQRLWDFVWKGVSGERRAGTRRQRGEPPPPLRRAATTRAQTDVAAAPSSGDRPTVLATPPPRQSRFGVSGLWAAIWGRPQQPVTRAKALPKDAEGEAQAAARRDQLRPPRVPARPRTGIRPLLWRLGLLGGRPAGRKASRKVPPTAASPDTGRGSPNAPVSAVGSQPQARVAMPGTRPADAKQKPPFVAESKPKRGVAPTAGTFWGAIANGAESARKGFWVGVFWTGRKARGGVDYMLRLLHLGGKRN